MALPLPSAANLFVLAQNRNYGDTSMGASQWIANKKLQHGNNWRRIVHNKIIKANTLDAYSTPKDINPVNPNQILNATELMGKMPWEHPVDQPIPWKPKNLIKNATQCNNQLDYIKCDPSKRFVTIDKSVYDNYGIPQDGTNAKQIPMFQFKTENGVTTERSQAEINEMHGKMDEYCTKVADNCALRFPYTPPSPEPQPETVPDPVPTPIDTVTKEEEEKEEFLTKYKYPLIAAGVVIVALMVMRNRSAASTVIVTK